MSAILWLAGATQLLIVVLQLRCFARLRTIEEALDAASERFDDFAEAREEAERVAARDRAMLAERIRAEFRRQREAPRAP